MMPFCAGSRKLQSFLLRGPPFVGIDDFAWKKGRRYGTLFLDLQTGSVLGLLPTREQAAVEAWIAARPEIQLITRDRSRSYKAAVEAASPAIKQVGDRWHILKLLREAAKKAVNAILPMKWVPNALEASEEGPSGPLPKRLQKVKEQEEILWARIQEVHHLRNLGYSITAIAEEMKLSRNTVYKDLEVSSKPSLARESLYAAFLPLIRALLAEGKQPKEIHLACQEAGFDGHPKTLSYLVADERRIRKRPQAFRLQQATLQCLWETTHSNSEEAFCALHPDLLTTFPELREIWKFVQSFRQLFQEKARNGLRHWLRENPSSSFKALQTFIQGVRGDLEAVYYAVTSPWSNGIMEGTINKLKTIKRMMYGRGSLTVLSHRLQFSFSSNR